MGKSRLVAKSLLVALAVGALTLLPQEAAARDHGRAFKHGQQHGQVSRFHAPPPKVFHFGQPHKRWQHRPAPRYFAPPGYRAWVYNPARFKAPRHHWRGWRWSHHRRGR